MNIRPAMESEAQVLSALVMRAKAHWGYSAEQLERWRPQLAVDASVIRSRPTFVAMDGEAWHRPGAAVPCAPHRGTGRREEGRRRCRSQCGGVLSPLGSDPDGRGRRADSGRIRARSSAAGVREPEMNTDRFTGGCLWPFPLARRYERDRDATSRFEE